MSQVVPNMNTHSGAKCGTLETTPGDITVKLSTISSELFLLPGRKYGHVSDILRLWIRELKWLLPGTNNIPLLWDIEDGKTGTESALRIALRFEEQTELGDLGTMIAPQNMYTTIWLNVKATKGIGFPSTVCSRKACIDVWSCDFSLLVGPGPSKNIAGQVPKRHPWRGRCSNYKNELDMFSGSWRDEYQFVHLDSWREEQFEHLNISTASPWLDIRGLDPWINYWNWYGRKNRCLRSVRRKPMFFIYVDRWCPPQRLKAPTPFV